MKSKKQMEKEVIGSKDKESAMHLQESNKDQEDMNVDENEGIEVSDNGNDKESDGNKDGEDEDSDDVIDKQKGVIHYIFFKNESCLPVLAV